MANLFSPEKVYATTGTFYPDADPETSTVDGFSGRGSIDETFSVIRVGAGTIFDDTSTSILARLYSSATTNQYLRADRAFMLFDTSSITGTVTNVVLSIYKEGLVTALGTPDLHFASSNPVSNTGLANGDYVNRGTTSFGSFTGANFLDAQYTNTTLNASGIANVTMGGISKFSALLSWDINNSFTGTWSASTYSHFLFSSAEYTGTSQDPKLVVTYTLPANPKQDVIWFD